MDPRSDFVMQDVVGGPGMSWDALDKKRMWEDNVAMTTDLARLRAQVQYLERECERQSEAAARAWARSKRYKAKLDAIEDESGQVPNWGRVFAFHEKTTNDELAYKKKERGSPRSHDVMLPSLPVDFAAGNRKPLYVYYQNMEDCIRLGMEMVAESLHVRIVDVGETLGSPRSTWAFYVVGGGARKDVSDAGTLLAFKKLAGGPKRKLWPIRVRRASQRPPPGANEPAIVLDENFEMTSSSKRVVERVRQLMESQTRNEQIRQNRSFTH